MNDDRSPGRGESRRKRFATVDKDVVLDYKNPQLLRNLPHRPGQDHPVADLGLSARQQRALTKAIKRARMLALLPFTST